MTAGKDPNQMQLWEHLEELRWTIFKMLFALLVGTLLCWTFTDLIFGLLMRPLEGVRDAVDLMFAGPLDAFLVKLKMALLGGIVITIPFLFWFLWSFVSPGLTNAERRLGWYTVTAGTVFFLIGATFAYSMIPLVLRFLAAFAPEDVRQMWHLKIYIGFTFRILLAFGILFELPVVIVLLVRLGLVEVETLQKGRPYAIILAFLVSAILTPPDIITQLILGGPLVLLYEIGILAGRWQKRKEARRLKTEPVVGDEAARADEASHDTEPPSAPPAGSASADAPEPSGGHAASADTGDLEDEWDEDVDDDYGEHLYRRSIDELADLPDIFNGTSMFDEPDDDADNND